MVILSIGASLTAQQVKNLPAMQEAQVRSLGQEDPLEDSNTLIPIFCLAGYTPWGHKELDMTEHMEQS